MGATHFKMKTLEKVKTEMSLHVLAYNLKRMTAILGPQPLMQAMRASRPAAPSSNRRTNKLERPNGPASTPDPAPEQRFHTWGNRGSERP